MLFAAMCVIWGIPYLLIRVAVGEISPAMLVFVRTGLAALILLPIAFARGGLGVIGGRWPALIAFAAVEVAAPWLLLSSAEQHITSALAGLLISAVPLVSLVIALTGIGFVLLARALHWHPLVLWVSGFAGVVGLLLLAVLFSSSEMAVSAGLLFFALIAEIGPVRATVITYVNPAVAGILGVAVLHESLTLGMGLGFLLVLVGSTLATRRPAGRPGRVADPTSPARVGDGAEQPET